MSQLLQEILLKPSNELKANRFVNQETDTESAPCTGQCKGGAGCITVLPTDELCE